MYHWSENERTGVVNRKGEGLYSLQQKMKMVFGGAVQKIAANICRDCWNIMICLNPVATTIVAVDVVAIGTNDRGDQG
jgi:hypothetical protein